jgi:hypothetical protein
LEDIVKREELLTGLAELVAGNSPDAISWERHIMLYFETIRKERRQLAEAVKKEHYRFVGAGWNCAHCNEESEEELHLANCIVLLAQRILEEEKDG